MKRWQWLKIGFGTLLWLGLLLTACSPKTHDGSAPDRLQVVTTTTLIGDTVRVVAGEQVDQFVLLPVGGDPHGFNPTPQDISKAADADVVFINGLELEAFLEELLVNANTEMNIVDLSNGINPITMAKEGGEEDAHGEFDPHVWWYPLNVAVWADKIATELARLDPEHAATYEENAAAYQQQLIELDQWITERVAQIPNAERIIVTDHDSLGYFVANYGFELVGTVFPGLSTQAEPSAQELAQLTDSLKEYQVPAIFVGTTVNTNLAKQVAQESGVAVVSIYTDSLSKADEPASTYLDFMRWNVETIVKALQP